MRKAKEPLHYFTTKFTDDQYARLAQAAAVLGTSISAMLRMYADHLPPVSPAQLDGWRRYRQRSGHEKMSTALEVRDAIMPAIAAAPTEADKILNQDAFNRREWDKVVAEEKAKDLREALGRRQQAAEEAKTGLNAPVLSVIERAELEERAENGDREAKKLLLEDEARRRWQGMTEL